jgi:hypothetical protein
VTYSLHDPKYSLQGNRKTWEGSGHPDRDAQVGHINATATAFLAVRKPLISVDTKQAEVTGLAIPVCRYPPGTSKRLPRRRPGSRPCPNGER